MESFVLFMYFVQDFKLSPRRRWRRLRRIIFTQKHLLHSVKQTEESMLYLVSIGYLTIGDNINVNLLSDLESGRSILKTWSDLCAGVESAGPTCALTWSE
jgi:hypothetical protein